MNLRDLWLRIRAMLSPRRVERELDDELAFHLELETRKHIARGLSPADARIRARAGFGSVPLAADRCRDARGTVFFDALARDVRYAFTMFRRAPLAALTIVATVALGLGLVAVVFTFYNALFLRVDAVRHPNELFEVRRPPYPGNTDVWEVLTRPDYDALRHDTNVFTDAFAMLPGLETRVDGRTVSGTLVTGNFFQVLGVDAAIGRALMPTDDERFAGRPVIVLSHRGWTKLFAENSAAIGQTVVLNGAPHEVIGVMPADFRGLAISPPDYWAPLDRLGQFRPALAGKEDLVPIDIIGRLKPGLSSEAATAALSGWAAVHPSAQTPDRRPATVFLNPQEGTYSTDVLRGLLDFSPLFFSFGLILMIACANVANLLLARGVSRQREIGVRLSLGASRRRIVRQLLTESLLLALTAAACGLVVSRWMLEAGAYAAAATMPPDVAELIGLVALTVDWRVVVFLVCVAVGSTAMFALVPALHATRLELIRTMRGELTRDARPSRARQALIAVQVGASAMLLICAAVFLRSVFAASSVTPSVRTTDTVLLEMANEPLRTAMLQAVSADPVVAAVAASWPGSVRQGILAEASVSSTDKPTETASRLPISYKFVSPEYFSLLDIDVLHGRGFTSTERSPGAGIVVVSETTARRLWPGRDAVGQVVRLDGVQHEAAPSLHEDASVPQLPFRAFTVVGVVRDAIVGVGSFKMTDAGMYLPTGPESPGTTLVLRVRGDPDQARQRLVEHLSKVDPAMGKITLMRTVAGRAVYVLRVAFWVTVVLGGLALGLTLSGLYSVLSYAVAQQSREIGVRMALGATTRNVAGLVLFQSVHPVASGLVIGSGLAGLLATALMASSVASAVGGLLSVFDPLAYGASLIVIIVACALAASIPAWRAARIDPIATLREH